MIAFVGPSSTEGSLLKGTSDDPSSGPLPLTPEKRLEILQKWQKQQSLYTEETREFILKSGFSRDQPEKVSSVGRSSTEGSLVEGTSDDPSSGPLPLTPEKRLEILQKWQKQQTLYTEETREFILKSGFSRDQPEKVSSVGPFSTEGSPLKGTSDDPSSGPLPLTPEKRLEILQKWQKQQTLYTEETREFILKSSFSHDQPEKVLSFGPSSTEGSLLKGTSDDPSSGPLPLTPKKRLEILQKWQKQQTLYTEETREFILKSGFSRDKQKKDFPSCPSDVEDTDSAQVQQQDTESALVKQQEQASSQSACQPVVTSLSDQTPFSSFDVYLSKDQWCRCDVCDRCILSKNKQSQLESTLHLTNVAAMKGYSDYVDLIKSKRSPDDKASDAVEITKFEKVPACMILHSLDYVDFIESKRIPDDKASYAVEITKFETVPADTILSHMLIQAHLKNISGKYYLLYKSDFPELGNANLHVFQISHRNKVLGTAFFFNPFPEGKKYLLTAGHVIAGYDEETVLATEGQFCYPASPVGISSIADVGVLRLKWPLLPMSPPRRPISIDIGTETSTHIYVVGYVSGKQTHQIEECLVLPSRDKDDGFIRFKSKLFSEGCFGSPCLVFKDGQFVLKGMLIGREEGTDTSYELIAITFRCVWKRLRLP